MPSVVRRVVALLAGVAVVATGALSARAAEDPSCPRGRCLDVPVPVPAGLRVPDPTVRVLLPEGYHTGHRRYPVLFLLHGAGDTYRSWTQNTDVVAFTRRLPLIVVMPDSGHDADAGWYTNWRDGSRQWETFHIGVLVPWVDAHFRTIRGDRAVAGLSMGGFGAMSYAGRHPGLFRAAASFSGAVDTRYLAPVSGVGFAAVHDRYGTPDSRVWGDQTKDAATWAAHNPTDLAARLRGVSLFVACGTGTPGGPAGDDPTDPGSYPVEHVVWQMNLSFVRALDRAGVAHTDDLYVGGRHSWPYWQRELHWALPKVLSILARAGR